ncbi:MAG: hypothetical protein KF763_15205 [Cyclobacteriaceae bacterium]|nr:hypothetical protein [Cyclobacteriaceae bacterium]
MKYELQNYEDLLRNISATTTPSSGKLKRENFLATIKEEITRIKQTFINEVFGFKDERHLERYIQYHQQALIQLLDETLKEQTASKAPLRELWEAGYRGLDDLLGFVEKHFSKYFDQDAKAPVAYVAIVRNDVRSNLAEVEQWLTERGCDQRLVESILFAPRKLALNAGGKDVSYRKVMFAKEVQKELISLKSRLDEQVDLNEELRNLLYYLNYNSIKSFAYHTSYIDTLLSSSETRSEMIERLSFILKKINQTQVKPAIAYNIQAPALKTQLTGYIVEEIDHLQRIQQLGQLPDKASDVWANFKIQVSLSVAQIACLVRLLVEMRIITNNNVSELLRFIAKICISKKVEVISYDSLRSKYYNVEQGTTDAVKAILAKLIKTQHHTP